MHRFLNWKLDFINQELENGYHAEYNIIAAKLSRYVSEDNKHTYIG